MTQCRTDLEGKVRVTSEDVPAEQFGCTVASMHCSHMSSAEADSRLTRFTLNARSASLQWCESWFKSCSFALISHGPGEG